jgi:hypothetical protein
VEPGDRPLETDSSVPMLFEKPHDRWDQFDVLSQFLQVSDELRIELRRQIARLEISSKHESEFRNHGQKEE